MNNTNKKMEIDGCLSGESTTSTLNESDQSDQMIMLIQQQQNKMAAQSPKKKLNCEPSSTITPLNLFSLTASPLSHLSSKVPDATIGESFPKTGNFIYFKILTFTLDLFIMKKEN